MVCIPCIVLPLFLWIYIKFLQPFVLRLLPERWRAKAENWLYPTCPARPPPPSSKKSIATTADTEIKEDGTVEMKEEAEPEDLVMRDVKSGAVVSEGGNKKYD